MSVTVEQPISHLRLPSIRHVGWRKVALACGVAASLLYFAMDAVAAALHDGYSYAGQTVQDNESTPWIGVTERIMLFGAMTWYAVLGVALLRRVRGSS